MHAHFPFPKNDCVKEIYWQFPVVQVNLFQKHLFLHQVDSDSDANIDEKDLVQSDPEVDEDFDEETLMVK